MLTKPFTKKKKKIQKENKQKKNTVKKVLR